MRQRSRPDFRYPWLLGALIWGTLGLMVLWRYQAIGGRARQIYELWWWLSLLWGQFGFAALFAEWRQGGRGFRFIAILTFLPPLVLYVLALAIALQCPTQ